MRQHDYDPQSQRNFLLIPITLPTDFANTDLPKIMANLCDEPVRSASPIEILRNEKVPCIAPASAPMASPGRHGPPRRER
jgi:hypothetical protein